MHRSARRRHRGSLGDLHVFRFRSPTGPADQAGGGPADAAWDELVARYEGRLRAYVRRRLRDHATTDDVVQETFIGFLNSLTNYDDKRDLQTWLFTIASHKVTDQLRESAAARSRPGATPTRR